MANTKRTLIILTATVAPMVNVARANPEARLNDYLNALALWWNEFKSLPVDILFCENSGYDLKPLRDWVEMMDAGSRIRVFQFDGDKSLVASLGKGAGEAEMFDECFRSNFISGYDYVMKSTGRLFVANAKVLLEQIIHNGGDWGLVIRGKLDFADTRFFIIKSALYQKYLLNLDSEVNDKHGSYIEHAMLRRVFRAIADGYKWEQFQNLPRYQGTGGTDGKRHSSLSGSLRYFVKNSLHRLGVRFGIYLFL